MPEIHHEINISAPPEDVFTALSTLRGAEGVAHAGRRGNRRGGQRVGVRVCRPR